MAATHDLAGTSNDFGAIISIIEMDYNYLEEKYSRPGIELLQREIKHFKEQYSDMDYEDIDPFTFLL